MSNNGNYYNYGHNGNYSNYNNSNNESVFDVDLGNIHAKANNASYQKRLARGGNLEAAERVRHANINAMAAFGFDPERNRNIIAEREAQLRNRAMYAMLNNLSNQNNNNNENGVNAEAHANWVSEREAELHMKALEDMEPVKPKPGMERYMFNRSAADDRYSRNVINSITRLLPKKHAIQAKAHRIHEKHINKTARNKEKKRLARVKELVDLELIESLRQRNIQAKRAEVEARLAREENARRQALEEFYAEAMRPAPGGLARANATHPTIPGRRNYVPEQRKSKRASRRTRRKVTRRRL
jgi:hypothetical protein